MDFDNKNVLITGGSDGIGKCIAKEFGKQGAHLWLVGRNLEKLKKVQNEIHQNSSLDVRISSVDFMNFQEVESLTIQIKQHWKSLDVLVNNAGIGIFKPIGSLTYNEYDAMFQVNVKTPFMLIKELQSLLMRNEGNVINISSYLASRMMPQLTTSVYSATKASLNALTASLSLELGPSVRVNAVAPGTIATEMSNKNLSRIPPEELNKLKAYIQSHYASKTIGEPQDVAAMVLFLASEKAKWISGAVFSVDGGISNT